MADSESEVDDSDVHVNQYAPSDSGSESNVAEQVDDASDDSESESESESDSGDSAAAGANAFFDLEASESGSEEDEPSHPNHGATSFHQFCRLPIELRHRVWDFFDPYMRAPARIFDITVVKRGGSLEAWAAATLEQQTAPARAVLSTYHESRALALRFYPNTAVLSHGVIAIPYHKSRDIIRVTGPWHQHLSTSWHHDIARIFMDVTRLAFEFNSDGDNLLRHELMLDLLHSPMLASLSALKAIYLCSEAEHFTASEIRWCLLDPSHRFFIQTEEQEIGVGEDLQYMYCWPKATAETSAWKQVERPGEEEETDNADADPFIMQTEDGCEVLRMIQFSSESGLRRFDKMKQAIDSGGIENYQSSDDDSDLDSEENEYESEGIDDSAVDIESDGSDSEDDLIVQQSSPNEHESSFGEFSPLEHEDQTPSNSAVGLPAEFSNLESESPKPSVKDGSDSEAAQSQRATRGNRRILANSDEEAEGGTLPEKLRRKDRIVQAIASDSDDDQDSGSEVAAPTTRRRARVVLSDSEDDDSAPAARSHQRPKVPTQDSSDSEEQSGAEDNESYDDESDENSEADEQPKKLSLAERIGAFRAEVPTDEGDSASEAEYDEFNDEGGAENDTNTGSYGAFQDDEEDDELSENDIMIMDVAEEGSEDDEDEQGW